MRRRVRRARREHAPRSRSGRRARPARDSGRRRGRRGAARSAHRRRHRHRLRPLRPGGDLRRRGVGHVLPRLLHRGGCRARDRVRTRSPARGGGWDLDPAPPRRVSGTALGIIGLGRIGRAVAWRARALGMRVLGFDPAIPANGGDGGGGGGGGGGRGRGRGDGGDGASGASGAGGAGGAGGASGLEGVELVSLPALLAQSEVVTLHALLVPGAPPILGASELAMMRPGAYLINCARAALVDGDALGAALRHGRLAGCALDVLSHEPPAGNEPEFDWPRTVINPHAAWYSPAAANEPYRRAVEAVAAVLNGREPADALARPR